MSAITKKYRVNRSYQFTIPPTIRVSNGIRVGDYLEMEEIPGGLIITLSVPKRKPIIANGNLLSGTYEERKKKLASLFDKEEDDLYEVMKEKKSEKISRKFNFDL